MRFYYGKDSVYREVTAAVLKYWWREGVLTIPASDVERARCLGDPLPGVEKDLKYYHGDRKGKFPSSCKITLSSPHVGAAWSSTGHRLPTDSEKLNFLHQHLHLLEGSMQDEYHEQLMAVKYIKPGATVLEIGGNIGRNSLIIASLLDDSSRLLTLECDARSAMVLREHRDINHLNFAVENAALSTRPLCQRHWTTIPYDGDNLPPGHAPVPTISWEGLRKKYSSLHFDTLVADCEGALLPILQDSPEVLQGINTVIVENDYVRKEFKGQVDALFTAAGLQVVYTAGFQGVPCEELASEFYQVWQRIALDA